MYYMIKDRITGEESPILLDGAEITEWLTTHYEDAPDEVYEAAEMFGAHMQRGQDHVLSYYESFFNITVTLYL